MKINRQILKLAFGLFLTINAFGQIPTNGLVAYYPFNGNANDESGNGNNGTVVGTLMNNIDRFSLPNNSYFFFGNNAIDVPESFEFGLNSFSASLWFNSTASGTRRFISNGNVSWSQGFLFGMGWNGNGKVSFGISSGSQNTSALISSVNTYNDGKWHHATFVVNKTSNLISIFVDGTKISIQKFALTGGIIVSNDLDISSLNAITANSIENNFIGIEPSNLIENINGNIDDIRIYSRALNLSEINALYTEGCDTYFAQTPTLTFDGTSMLTQTYAGANYAWSLNGSSISGANYNVYSGTISAGTYNVTITNAACKSVASYVQANDVVNTANGLVAYYPFNGNANDESGNGNNGTAINGAILTKDRFGTNNATYTFDGINALVTAPGQNIQLNKEFTISVWYKTNNNQNSSYTNILDKSHSASNLENGGFDRNWCIQKNNLQDEYYLYYNTSNGTGEFTNFNIIDKSWGNVIFVKNDFNLKIYSNGVLVSNTNKATSNINLTNLPLYIGGARAENRFFKGLIDDIRIYSRAFNQSEISALWDNCIGTDINTMNLPISGSNSVCMGSSNTFSIASTTGISYNWSVSGGNTFTVNGNNLNVTANNIGVYTITAMPTYACGNGTVTSSFVVSVSGTAPTPTITGNLMPISCVTENYLATVASGSGIYNWATSENHVLPISSTIGIMFTSTGVKQIYVVRVDSQCNFTTTSNITVTVSAPNLDTPIVTRTANLSNLQSTNVTTSGVSFQWVKDNLDEPTETYNIHNSALENATYRLRADLSICATAISDPYNVFVTTFIPAALTVVSAPITVTSAPVTVTSAPITVTSAPVTVVSPPVTITSAPVTVTSPPITITSAPITVTSVVTVSSPPVTVTSVVTVSSPPVTVTSVINNCTSTGTNNNRLTTSFSIYPNPSSGVFTIESEGVEIYSIKVYASDGRLVYHEKFASKLDLSNLPSGIYKMIAYDKEDKPLGSVNIAKE